MARECLTVYFRSRALTDRSRLTNNGAVYRFGYPYAEYRADIESAINRALLRGERRVFDRYFLHGVAWRQAADEMRLARSVWHVIYRILSALGDEFYRVRLYPARRYFASNVVPVFRIIPPQPNTATAEISRRVPRRWKSPPKRGFVMFAEARKRGEYAPPLPSERKAA